MRPVPNINAAITINLPRPRTVFLDAEIKRSRKGSGPGRPHEKSQGPRSSVKNIFRKDGQEHVVRHADKTYESEKEKDIPYRKRPGCVPISFFEAVKDRTGRLNLLFPWYFHAKQGCDDCQETEPIKKKAYAFACNADQNSCYGRARAAWPR